jgi:hypothetical protein
MFSISSFCCFVHSPSNICYSICDACLNSNEDGDYQDDYYDDYYDEPDVDELTENEDFERADEYYFALTENEDFERYDDFGWDGGMED